jgi:hypothetical protein
MKLYYYPWLIVKNNLLFLFFLPVSLYALLEDRERTWKLIPLLIGAISLIVYCIFNVISVPPSAAPHRYSLLFSILLSPYIAFGFHKFISLGKVFKSPTDFLLKVFIPVSVLTVALVFNIYKAVDFPDKPNRIFNDSVQAGNYLNNLLNSTDFSADHVYMLELITWDFRGVQLTARHYDQMIYDRKKNWTKPETSIFTREAEVASQFILNNKVRFVVLKDPHLKEKAGQIRIIKKYMDIGAWTIFRVDLPIS